MLDIRKAKKDDLERIMEIYRYAQELMIESGNPTQWGRTFPDIELIRSDIESGISYVITDESGVQGVFALGEGDDPTYQLIEDGEWPSDAPYLTVHRIASGGQVRGVFGFALQQIKSMANDIRIDTHENNKVMRRQIEKHGFKRCGTIFVRDGSPRIAYQWTAAGTVRLETERLVLRRYVIGDAEALYESFGTDEKMFEFSGWNPYATVEMARDSVSRSIAEYDAYSDSSDERSFGWAVEMDGKLVGTVGAYDYDPGEDSIEIGISIFRPFWGMGLASEVLAKVLEHLTGECGIAVVKAWCAEDNIGSKRAMEKCGMSFAGAKEGALEIGGETFTRLDYEYRAAAEEAGKAATESAAETAAAETAAAETVAEIPVRIRLADPAGNITVFVLDRFAREDYARVATAILDMEDIAAEQVAFITGDRSMEMCGLEFCGNASRAFALMCAEKMQGDGVGVGAGGAAEMADAGAETTISVEVSGADGPVEVTVRKEDGYARIAMPLPVSMTEREDLGGTLIDLGGITHLVLEDSEASDERFEELKNKVAEESDPPAFGVMFMKGDELTPVVYVKDVDSVYYEGSCASGTTAVMAARACGKADGTYNYDIKQPCGELSGSVTVSGGNVSGLSIEGPVGLGEEMTVRLTLCGDVI